MEILLKGLVGLAALAFILAVIGSLLGGPIVGTAPEAYSRACTNLALLAIAASICLKREATPG